MTSGKLLVVLGLMSVVGVAFVVMYAAAPKDSVGNAVDPSSWTDQDLVDICRPIVAGNLDEKQEAYIRTFEGNYDRDEIMAAMQGVCTKSFRLGATDDDATYTAEWKSLDSIATFNVCTDTTYYVQTFREIFMMIHNLMSSDDASRSQGVTTFMNVCMPSWALECAEETCDDTNSDTCEEDCVNELTNTDLEGDRRLLPVRSYVATPPGGGARKLDQVLHSSRKTVHTLVERHMARLQGFELDDDVAVDTADDSEAAPAMLRTSSSRQLASPAAYPFMRDQGFCNYPNGKTGTVDWERNRNAGTCARQTSCLYKAGAGSNGPALVNDKDKILNQLQGWMTAGTAATVPAGDTNYNYLWGCVDDSKPAAFTKEATKFFEENWVDWTAPNGKAAKVYEPCNAQSGLDFDKIICDTYNYEVGFSWMNWDSNKFSGAMKDDPVMVKLSTMLGAGNLFYHGGSCGGKGTDDDERETGVGQRFDTMPMDLMFAHLLKLAGGTPQEHPRAPVTKQEKKNPAWKAMNPTDRTNELWNMMKDDYRKWPAHIRTNFNFKTYTDSITELVAIVIHTCVPESGIKALDGWIQSSVDSVLEEFAGEIPKPNGAKLAFDPWMCRQIGNVVGKFVNALLYQEMLIVDADGEVCFLGKCLTLNNFNSDYDDQHAVPCEYNPHSEWHFHASTVIGEFWALAKAVELQKKGLGTNQKCFNDAACATGKYCGRTTGKCHSKKSKGNSCTWDYECSNRCKKFSFKSCFRRLEDGSEEALDETEMAQYELQVSEEIPNGKRKLLSSRQPDEGRSLWGKKKKKKKGGNWFQQVIAVVVCTWNDSFKCE